MSTPTPASPGPAGTPGDRPVAALFDAVVGQPAAVEALRAAARAPVHAYLLVGPPGSGRRAAALGFAAAVLCPDGGCGTCRSCRLALAGAHPDVRIVERVGASLSAEQAREVVRLSSRTPVESDRQVLVLEDLHLVGVQGPMLLKTIEEPGPSTLLVGIADEVTPDLVTIASRCVKVAFGPVPHDTLVAALVAEGAAPATAEAAAEASGGNLDRARLLVTDPHLAERAEAWYRLPDRLDGTGAAVAVAVDDLVAHLDAAGTALAARQKAEVAELEARVAATGERGAGRAALEARHRREARRLRTDELRAGLAVLARRYRDALVAATTTSVAGPGGVPAAPGGLAARAPDAVSAIDAAAEALVRNPNEELLLSALLLRLGSPTRPGR